MCPTLTYSSLVVKTRGGCSLLPPDPPATLLLDRPVTPHTVFRPTLDLCTARPRHGLLQYKKTMRYYFATLACVRRGSLYTCNKKRVIHYSDWFYIPVKQTSIFFYFLLFLKATHNNQKVDN